MSQYIGRMHRKPSGSFGALSHTSVRATGMPRAALVGFAALVLSALAMVASLPLGEAIAAFSKIATILR